MIINPYVYSLNLLPGAIAAYSLRNLSSQYSGSVVRVRRASDNTEENFTAAQISDGSLPAFCGASNGFVSVWYSQTGGNHATQSTAVNQPKIYDASTGLVTKNGKPGILWVDGQNHWLRATFAAQNPQPATIATVFEYNGALGQQEYAYASVSVSERRDFVHVQGNNIWTAIANNTLSVYLETTPSVSLWFNVYNGANSSFYRNGVLVASGNAGTSTLRGITLGNFSGPAAIYNLDGVIQEFVMFGSDRSSDRGSIESNINNYYGLY